MLVKSNYFPVLVLGFDVVDSVENDVFSQIVCIGLVGNRRNRLLVAPEVRLKRPQR